MRKGNYFLASAACVISVLGAWAGESTSPKSNAAPTTAPAGGVVRGRVSIAGGLSLQKPDLTRVVVFLASNPVLDARSGPATRAASVAQEKKSFVPNFTVVPRGTKVEFPNHDHFDHNVFSRSAAAPAFDLLRYPYGESKDRVFDKLGIVQVFCNIHPQMRGVIYVTPNGYFTRADADGTFQVSALPDGDFEIVAWQERCEEQRQPIKVRVGEPVDVTFTLKESRERVISSSDVDRRASYGVERGLGVKREKLNLPVVTESHPEPVLP